jgi:hypothetical protein
MLFYVTIGVLSFGVVVVGEDESGEYAVVDGLDGLLFLGTTVSIHAFVGLKQLQDLSLLVFFSGLGQKLTQFLQFLVVNVQQVFLLVESLGQN